MLPHIHVTTCRSAAGTRILAASRLPPSLASSNSLPPPPQLKALQEKVLPRLQAIGSGLVQKQVNVSHHLCSPSCGPHRPTAATATHVFTSTPRSPDML